MFKTLAYSFFLLISTAIADAAYAGCKSDIYQCASGCIDQRVGNIDSYQNCRASCQKLEDKCIFTKRLSNEKQQDARRDRTSLQATSKELDIETLPIAAYDFNMPVTSSSPQKATLDMCNFSMPKNWDLCLSFQAEQRKKITNTPD